MGYRFSSDEIMKTRREVLRMIPPAVLAGTAHASAPSDFTRIDTHIHIHRDAPALLSAIKEAHWRGLDIVVCPASGGEAFDLEEKLQATAKVSRESGGTLAWASTFDARGFEDRDFTERTIARLRQSFADGAIGVKIWKNIGMSIKDKSGAYLLPDDTRTAADLRGDSQSRENAGGAPCRAGWGVAAARWQESRVAILFGEPAVAHVREKRGTGEGRYLESA